MAKNLFWGKKQKTAKPSCLTVNNKSQNVIFRWFAQMCPMNGLSPNLACVVSADLINCAKFFLAIISSVSILQGVKIWTLPIDSRCIINTVLNYSTACDIPFSRYYHLFMR